MASPAEIANDMDARARLLARTHFKDHAQAMQRAAKCIRELAHDNQILAENTHVNAIVVMGDGDDG